jgi:hypothetical protein
MRWPWGLAFVATVAGCADFLGLGSIDDGASDGLGAGGDAATVSMSATTTSIGGAGGADGASSSAGGGGAGGVGGAIDALPFANLREIAINDISADDDDPTVSANGLIMVFNSTRQGGAGLGDLWLSVRTTITDEWGTPTAIAGLNTAADEGNPVLSPDGLTLWFHRDGSS